MMQESVVLKRSRYRLMLYAVFCAAFTIAVVIDWMVDAKNYGATLAIAIIFSLLFFYFLHAYIRNQAEITLTPRGIELRDKGSYTWDTIQSVSTLQEYDNSQAELVIYFKENKRVKFAITDLEQKPDDVIKLILQFGNRRGIIYKGIERY